jgi:hypothetical protein
MTGPSTDLGYLFIVGCPRSGTTALWQLLTSHPRICLGVERFAKMSESASFIEPALFEQQRFFDIRPGDTFYSDLSFGEGAYEGMQARYSDALYRGDKIPQLYQWLPLLFETFQPLKVVFIFRNVFDVAASYVARANEPYDMTWSSDWGAAKAVADWSAAVEMGLRVADRPGLLFVEYEMLYGAGQGLEALFSFLNLEIEDSVRTEWAREMQVARELEADRKRELSPVAVAEIVRRAPFVRYRELLGRLQDSLVRRV